MPFNPNAVDPPIEILSKLEFQQGAGRVALQSLEVVEGGLYDSGWTQDEDQEMGQEDGRSRAGDSEAGMGGSAHAGKNARAKIAADEQARKGAALRLQAFLAQADHSPLTVSQDGPLNVY